MIKLFLDLDGTLARFNVPDALNRFTTEPKFFRNLLPYKNIMTIDRLAKQDNVKVYIISASPNIGADLDKREWVREYLPSLSMYNTIIYRIGQNKSQVIMDKLGITLDKECILLDDYTKNLIEWEQAGGKGIKRITSVADNSTKKWQGLEIRDLKDLERLF